MTAALRRAVRRLLPIVVLLAALAPDTASAQAAGAAQRGEAIFAAKQCARCHRPGEPRGVGPPLERLRRRQGEWELAGRLWNHAPAMFTTLAQEGVAWPEISPAEMADLMAYLQADAALDVKPDAGRGHTTLIAKGCLKCHAYRGEGGRLGPDLANRRQDFASAPAFASRMWRHTPRMAVIALERGIMYPRFHADEMAQLVGYLRSGGL